MSPTDNVILVCLFHDSEFAQAAVEDLVSNGISPAKIFQIGGPDRLGTDAEGSEIGREIGRFHLPQSDVDMLTKGLDGGGTLVAVEAGENQGVIVETVFARHNAAKIDEKNLDGNRSASRFGVPRRSGSAE